MRLCLGKVRFLCLSIVCFRLFILLSAANMSDIVIDVIICAMDFTSNFHFLSLVMFNTRLHKIWILTKISGK